MNAAGGRGEWAESRPCGPARTALIRIGSTLASLYVGTDPLACVVARTWLLHRAITATEWRELRVLIDPPDQRPVSHGRVIHEGRFS